MPKRLPATEKMGFLNLKKNCEELFKNDPASLLVCDHNKKKMDQTIWQRTQVLPNPRQHTKMPVGKGNKKEVGRFGIGKKKS